ncbi:tail component [Caulobacter phage TMCBR2]|uniref:Tail component n=1 Tax=Caulobacter phage TMCBR2 TaxID=3025404 RepID=A0AAF0BYK8_9CAUD|nr:tail component [Caulobacter phage TMCBR2]WDS38258.1 tail component [Caulobacter phage TMCBR3]
MAIRVGMTLQGLDELEAALRELPTRLAKNTLRRSLLKAAKIMEEAMAGNAPSNRLRVRIVTSASLSKRQRAMSPIKRKPSEVTVYVGSRPLRHAHLVEFGSGPRYNKAGAYRGSMPAHPYVRPGFDSTAMPVIVEFGRILGPEIERTAARYAKKQAKAKAYGNV